MWELFQEGKHFLPPFLHVSVGIQSPGFPLKSQPSLREGWEGQQRELEASVITRIHIPASPLSTEGQQSPGSVGAGEGWGEGLEGTQPPKWDSASPG